MIKRALGLVVVVSTLAGCATMTKEECLVADWHTVGFEDGANGYMFERLSQRRKACAEYSIAPNFNQYQRGRDAGLRKYCSPQRGFSLGKTGKQYHGVCPIELETPFLQAFRVGSELRRHRLVIKEIDQQLQRREHSLEELYEQVTEKEATLVSDNTEVKTRVLLLSDLKKLSEQKGEIEAEIDALLQERVYAKDDLAEFERTVTELGY